MNFHLTYLKSKNHYSFIKVFPLAMTGLIISCQSDELASEHNGYLSLDLKADLTKITDSNALTSKANTRAGAFGDFNPEDYDAYQIDILQKGELVKAFSYSEMPESVELREGSYELNASLGYLYPAAYDAPFFRGSEVISISDNKTTSVSVTTKLANTKVDVSFSEAFEQTYEDFRLSFGTVFTGNDSLKFPKGETRSIYFQSESIGTDLGLTMYVKPKGKDWLKAQKNITIKPQEFVHYNFKTDKEDLMSKLGIEISIDKTTIDTTLSLNISNMYLPLSAPDIQVNRSSVETYEGIAQDIDATISAPGFIKNCFLYVNSPKLIEQGWKSVYDLASLSESDASDLRMKGLTWNNILSTSVMGVIGFNNLIANLNAGADSPESYQFALIATDLFPITGKSDSVILDISVNVPEFNMQMGSADAWATKASIKAEAVSGKGVSSKISGFKFKSNDGAETYVPALHKDGIAYADIAGLTPSTDYSVSAVYGSHRSPEISFITEKALQVENASMEMWSENTRTNIVNGSNIFSSRKSITAYYPYASSESCYWTCVNQKTFEGSPNILSSYNVVPSMKKVDGRTGSAALIRTVGWDNNSGNTSTIVYHVAAGKLFMGSYSFTHKNGPEQYLYGQPFTSRPTSVSAYFKYAPYNGDSFKAWAVVENRDNDTVTQLGYGELVCDETLSDFTKKTFSINYSNTTKKATHFYIVFSSSADCSDDENTESSNLKSKVSLGSVDGYSHHEGSNLTIDDIQINY